MNAIQNLQIETIKERVFQCIKEHNGAYDLVDISCEFKEYTVDIPSLAASRLVDEGRVERRELYGNRCAYFVRD